MSDIRLCFSSDYSSSYVEDDDEKNFDSGREHSYTFLGWSVVYGTTQFWGTIWHRYFIIFELHMTQ